MDPFATLGITRSFEVDLQALERTHRELSRAFHPDRHVTAPAAERREALAHAIEVNEAFRIVRDPLRRAEALLALAGVSLGQEPEPDGEFLLDMLERRESLAEARHARDRRALWTLAEDVRARSDVVERELSSGLASGASEPLVGALGKLRFFRRFLDEVSAIEDEMV